MGDERQRDDPAGRKPAFRKTLSGEVKASRHEIAQGAAEMQVDEFLDSALFERPRTVPPVPARGTADREQRATRPGLGEGGDAGPARSRFWAHEAEPSADEPALGKTIPLGTHHARPAPQQAPPEGGAPRPARNTRPFDDAGERAASEQIAQRDGKIAELQNEVERLRAQMRASPVQAAVIPRPRASTLRPDQSPIDDAQAALARFTNAARSHTEPMQRTDLPAPAAAPAAAPAPADPVALAIENVIADAIHEAELTPTIEVHPSEPPPIPPAPTFDLPAHVREPSPPAPTPEVAAPTPPPMSRPAVEPAPKPLVSAPKRRSGSGQGRAALMAVLATCAVAMAGAAYAYRVGIGPFERVAPLAPPAAVPTDTTAAEVAQPEPPAPVAKPAPTPQLSMTAEPSPIPSASASDPTAAASAAPSSEPSASAAPEATASAGPMVDESAGLLSFQAHLTVTSSADAEVVVQGQAAGRTNQRVLTRCGPRNVRLRGTDGVWLTDGQHVQITCMKHTSITLEPR